MPPHHLTLWRGEVFEKIVEKFDLELLGLHKEPLSRYHRDAYAETLLLSTGIKKRIDISLKYSLIKRLCWPLKQIIKLGIKLDYINPEGQTIVAVFRKKKV